MIELRHLRHLLALARHGNFSRAAAEVGLTQPALSRSIQSLEALVGTTLLARNRTGVEPTEMGRLVLRHAEMVDASARDLDRDIRLAQGLELGELHIGVGPLGASTMVGSVVGKLSSQHPNLRIRIVAGPWDEIPDRLRRREIDVAVADSGIFSTQPDLESRALAVRSAVIVGRPGHPLASKEHVDPSELFQYPLAGPLMSEAAANALLGFAPASWRAERARLGQENNPITIECDNAGMLRDILLASDALSALPATIARDKLVKDSLVVLRGLDIGMQGCLGAAWLGTRSLSQSGKRFLDLLVEEDERLGA